MFDVCLAFALAVALGEVVFLWRRLRAGKAREKQLRHEYDLAMQEMRLRQNELDLSKVAGEWSGLEASVLELIRETEVDRFMLLRAWNGVETPKWVTAVVQIRAAGQEVVDYFHTELDDDYVERLRQTRRKGVLWFQTEHIADSLIRAIYESEGVTASMWAHVESRPTANGASRIVFASFATHNEEGLSPNTILRCRLLADRLRGAAHVLMGTAGGADEDAV